MKIWTLREIRLRIAQAIIPADAFVHPDDSYFVDAKYASIVIFWERKFEK